MKYRTVIELVCEASDKEDAMNIAGDYLKGDVDFGVDMRCKTNSFVMHKVKKYALTSVVALLLCVSMLFTISPMGAQEKISSTSSLNFQSTSTILPALKTKHKEEFKQEWEQKKDEAVLEYLKK